MNVNLNSADNGGSSVPDLSINPIFPIDNVTRQTRSGRNIKPPSYLQDHIH